MKLSRWLAFPLLALLLAGAGHACIKALTLDEMVGKTDAAVLGTVTNVETVRYTPPGDDRMIYTVVTVEGEDLYTGKARTLKAAFVGGTYQGESMLVTSMPAPSEYRLGSRVLAFSAPVDGWGPQVGRCLYAAMGGVFQVHGDVVFGKGEGFAIEGNLRLQELRQGVARALEQKQEAR